MTAPKLPKLIVQLMQYSVGGGLYFVVGYIVFAVCYSGFHWNWWISKIIADIIGWMLNYLVQRYWAFASPALQRHEGRTRTRYAALSVLNLFLDYLIVGGLQRIGISPYIGMFVAAGFFTVWNFVIYKHWVFRSEYNKSQA